MKSPSWLPIVYKRLGEVMFGVTLALVISVIVNSPTVVVHVIGHPAYITNEAESVDRIVIKTILALFCFVLGCFFDTLYKDKVND